MHARTNAPDEPPRLLPGRTAFEWNRRGTRAAAAALLVGVLMAMSVGLPMPIREYSLAFLMLVGLGTCGVWIHADINRGRAELREIRSGYATLPGRSRGLWLLGHKTGEVLRRPDASVHGPG